MRLGEASFKGLVGGLHLENPWWTKRRAFEKVHLLQSEIGEVA